MAEGTPIGKVPVNELREVQDLAANFERTISQVDEKFNKVNEKIGSVKDRLQTTLDLQKGSTDRAKELSNQYSAILTYSR